MKMEIDAELDLLRTQVRELRGACNRADEEHERIAHHAADISQQLAECERKLFETECEREEARERLVAVIKSNEGLRLKAVIADMPMSEVEEMLKQQLAECERELAAERKRRWDGNEMNSKELAAVTKERDELVSAMHHISLCSRNSMSSQRECGVIARAALAKVGAGKTGDGS
jgi:septal ring factor EnvC (AmiA/AmiB activator)